MTARLETQPDMQTMHPLISQELDGLEPKNLTLSRTQPLLDPRIILSFDCKSPTAEKKRSESGSSTKVTASVTWP